MSTVLSRWRAAEPLRLYLYGLLVPGAALAIAYGLVDGDEAALWLAFGGIALGATGGEVARRHVTPYDETQPPPRL